MQISVGYVEDEVPPKRVSFWSLGKVSKIEVTAVVGILAIMVGIVASTVAG